MCVGGKWSPCAALAQHKFDTTLETPICTLYFLTSKSLEKTTNSPPQLNVSLNSVVFLQTLRVLQLICTNTP